MNRNELALSIVRTAISNGILDDHDEHIIEAFKTVARLAHSKIQADSMILKTDPEDIRQDIENNRR